MSLKSRNWAVLILTLITVHCAAYYKARSETIAATTEGGLRSGDLEAIYESLDETTRSLTPKTEFLERGARLLDLMKQSDPELKFVKSREGGVNPDAISNMYFEYRSLGSEEKRIDVEIWIDLHGVPKLYDVCASPAMSETVETQRCLTNALRKI